MPNIISFNRYGSAVLKTGNVWYPSFTSKYDFEFFGWEKDGTDVFDPLINHTPFMGSSFHGTSFLELFVLSDDKGKSNYVLVVCDYVKDEIEDDDESDYFSRYYEAVWMLTPTIAVLVGEVDSIKAGKVMVGDRQFKMPEKATYYNYGELVLDEEITRFDD